MHVLFFDPYFKHGYETSYIAALFANILKNPEVSRTIRGKNGNPKFLERIIRMNRGNVVDGWQKEFPDYAREYLDHVFDFVFAGSMQLILGWIENGQTISTDLLANRLERLGHYCHMAITEFITE